MKELINKNLIELRGQIADTCEEFDRDTDDIVIVAVSKTFPAQSMKTVIAAGIHDIGESRLQHAEPKILELGPIARYHMVGQLQTNKVKKVVSLFDVIQSVGSLKIAEEINRRAGEIERTIECLIQINITNNPDQGGVSPSEVQQLADQISRMDHITLSGLMTIGPHTENESDIRKAFAQCRRLFEDIRSNSDEHFDTLSMGMSHDFRLAIAEGSTMIRIGTGLFGPRQQY